MSQFDYNTAVEYLPTISEKVPFPDEKFLFFFDPELVDQKFLFGLPFKTGAYIFSTVVCIQALSAFFNIFRPDSFWFFLVSIFAFVVYFAIAFYGFLGVMKNNYHYTKVSYLIIATLFLIDALRYAFKSLFRTIEFITPWDAEFLRLDFLIYVFGYGIYLLIYLYLIFVFYRFMLQLKNGEISDDLREENTNENENKEENLISNEDNNA